MKAEIIQKLRELNGELLLGEPLAPYTTFRVGGAAEGLFLPKDSEALREAVRLAREEELPLYIMGNGSNLLVSDRGLRGLVIRIGKEMSRVTVTGNRLFAEAGVSLAKLSNEALSAGLTGLEFASGIPGTLGGGIVMNAGAYGGELKDVVTHVTYLTDDGEVKELPAEELSLGYRTSRFQSGGGVVLSACMTLREGDPNEIRARMQDYANRRKEKQPLEYPSAGSTFKRPEGYFAGALIENAGLKGFSVGDAAVSEKHAGFVINRGNASAQDVYTLIRAVQDKVEADSGVRLEPEVKMWGDFE